jgi:cephalosporin hydroxylase
MSETTKFQEEVAENIKGLGKDRNFQELSRQWLQDSVSHKYSYNFTWLGRPAIQLPTTLGPFKS